jgi:uncharacterized repeat protein (TIGR03837 family)
VPHEVVIEAFGCELPAAFVERMAACAPVWINLEHLSAESFVERSHGLPSPVTSGPAAGLTKWFFFPGFAPATGGLIREPWLGDRQASFDRDAWLAEQHIGLEPGERLISVFCYEHASLEALGALWQHPCLLLLTPGAARRLPQRCSLSRQARQRPIEWLDQDGYDRLLWACDLNIVRGEDSLVRALWAGRPFLWNLYAQPAGAHLRKLDAFVERFGAEQVDGLPALWRAFNGASVAAPTMPDLAAWYEACRSWRKRLRAGPELTAALVAFAYGKALGSNP